MLQKDDVTAIKVLLASGGQTQKQIADQYGVSRSLISDIATGRRHKDVPWPGKRKKNLDYDPTDQRVRELESEVLHLREERDLARRSAREDAKRDGLFRAMAEELGVVKPFTALPPQWQGKQKGQIDEHLVMHVSDGHHDQIITPEECGGLEKYDFPISCRRAETYIDTVLDWTQETLNPRFNFSALTMLFYGDHTSGEIHGHTQRSYYRNQFKNCLAIGQLHALMIRDLHPFFPAINVVYLPGNHGRRTKKKDYHGAHDNWDFLIGTLAKEYCRDLENVAFLIPDSFSLNLEINGVGFNISHGDDVKGWSGIPFYGMVRRQKGLLALGAAQNAPRLRYFVMGHHHVAASLADIDGELLVNGAWTGTDSYAYNSFSGYREPTQWIHGVNPKHGITWRMAVHLKTNGEESGPNRYQIEV